MKNWLERTELLIGEDGLKNLNAANVLVVGLGGVGSFAAEFLCRAGIGRMTIVDGDIVDITNINRQLPALHSTIGQSKAQLMAARLLDINPAVKLTVLEEFLQPERMRGLVSEGNFDYVLDCIDSVTPKLNLMMACMELKIKLISSMGAGGHLDSLKVKIADISKSHTCKFALQIRKQMKRHGVKAKGFPVVFSEEPVIESSLRLTDGTNFKKSFYGTISYIPALFGLHIAGYVIQELANPTN
jgi:tRNA threonylcarbamoyladenosine dehydratase